jgi:hypothetical protein
VGADDLADLDATLLVLGDVLGDSPAPMMSPLLELDDVAVRVDVE